MTTEALASYQEALASLDDLLDAMDRELRAARAARPGSLDAMTALVASVCRAAEIVRGGADRLAEAAAEPAPEWKDRAELDAAVRRLAQRIQEREANRWRRQLEEAAVALQGGRVVRRRTRRVVSALDELRVLAAEDAARLAAGHAALTLPGPIDGPWLDWVWKQPGDQLDAILAPLREPAPELYKFLLDVDPDDWQAESPVASPEALTLPPAFPAPYSPVDPEPAPRPPAADAAPGQPTAPAPDLISGDQVQAAVPEAAAAVAFVPPGDPPAPAPPAPGSVLSSDGEESLRPLPAAPPPTAPAPPVRPPEPTAKVVPPPAPEPPLADAAEIAARGAKGDYLGAVLLAAGRAFDGLEEVDPRLDALLVSHHVLTGSRIIPWPDWCYDPAVAERMCQTAPDSVRLTFLAAQCQAHRSDGGAESPPKPVAQKGVDAFNDLPEVRTWLNTFLETTTVPGLWAQVCRPAQPDPLVEYRQRRKEFVERYESGLLHRNDKAAYIHRQDHFLSRHPAAKVLFDHLPSAQPIAVAPETRRQITSFLEKRPEALTEEWHASTQRVSGKITLRGQQRADLVRRAAEFLELAHRAWRAAETLGRGPPQMGDVERRRKQLRDLFQPALNRAQGRPWRPLFQRLGGGLSS